MSKKNYKVDEVIRSLSQKGCFITNVDETRKTKLMFWNGVKIEHRNYEVGRGSICVNNAHDLGNGSWGKIDFLIKYHWFTLFGLGTYKKRCELNN